MNKRRVESNLSSPMKELAGELGMDTKLTGRDWFNAKLLKGIWCGGADVG